MKTPENFINVGTMCNKDIWMTEADHKQMKKELCAGRVKAYYPKTNDL